MSSPSGFADEFRNQLDIVEVIGGYLPLKKKARDFWACCPFHEEKTPSFKVSPDKQFYHCFGCHKGGDAIRFVMEVEHLDFRGAIQFLADRYNLAPPKFTGPDLSSEDDKRRKLLIDLNEMATEFFVEQLGRNREALAYFEKRGLDHDLIEALRLGYASPGAQSFLAHARQRKFSDAILCEAGLVKVSEKSGRLHDGFWNRVMFPICDPVGKVVAFGGRVLDPTVQPKYLNSPETLVYHKSQYLYAYHLAKNAIKDRGFAIITEGYMDAIACHQYGFTNAVASLGTAFTESMARLLKRLCSSVVFLYDGDAPGQKAMYGGTRILLAHDFQVRIVALPPEDDPDTLLRREGTDALHRMIATAPDYLDFFLRASAARHDSRVVQGQVAIVEYLKELAAGIVNPIARHDCVRRISDFLALPETTVAKSLFDQKTRVRDVIGSDRAGGQAPPKADRHEIGLLRLMIEYEVARSAARDMIRREWLFDSDVKSWFEKIGQVDGSRELTYTSVLDMAENETESSFLRMTLIDESEPVADFERSFREIYSYLGSRFHDKVMRDIHEQLADAEKANDSERLSLLARQKREIARQRKIWGDARYGNWSSFRITGTTP